MKSLAFAGVVLLTVMFLGSLIIPAYAGHPDIPPDWSSDEPYHETTAATGPTQSTAVPTTAPNISPASSASETLFTGFAADPGEFAIDIAHMWLVPVDTYLTNIPFRVKPTCTSYGEFYKDSSIAMHAHPLVFPDGWPHLADTGSHADGVQVDPHQFWMAFTPLGTPLAQGPCDESIHIVAGPDGLSYSNQVGPNPGDTVTNPIFYYDQFHMAPTDTVFWYFDTDYSNGRDDGWPADTGHYNIDSVGRPGWADTVWQGQICTHLADPELFIDDQNNLWVTFLAAYPPGSKIFASRSADGVHWSPPVAITHLGYWVCPSVVPNGDGTFSLYVMHIYDTGFHKNALYRYQSADLGSIWENGRIVPFSGGNHYMDTTAVTMGNVDGDSCFLWHYDIVPFDANQWFMIYSGRINDMTGDNRWLGAGVSRDQGASFEFAQTPLATAPILPWNAWDSVPYAPSGYFTKVDSHTVFRAYVSSRGNSASDSWHTGTYDVKFYNVNYNIDGVVFIINYIFRSGAEPFPVNSADVNGDCMINLGDAIYLIDYIFRGGPGPTSGCVE